MIKQALKQIWKERKINTWLFVELIIVFVVSCLMISTIFAEAYTKRIPVGFNEEGVYVIRLHCLPNTATIFDSTRAELRDIKEDVLNVANTIKAYPQIDAAALHPPHYPLSGMMITNNVFISDSLNAQIMQPMEYINGWDYWEVFQFEPLFGQSLEDLSEAASKGVIVTKQAQRMIDEVLTDAEYNEQVKITVQGGEYRPVTGVINYVKNRRADQPSPMLFSGRDTISDYYAKNMVLSVRTTEEFIQSFEKEIAPKLRSGNIFVEKIVALEDHQKDFNPFNSPNYIYKFLTTFVFIAVFLGLVGAFWLKIEARKGEIGLRLALGATKTKVLFHLIVEGLLLLACSIVVAIFILLNISILTGGISLDYSMFTIPEAWIVNNSSALISTGALITTLLMSMIVVLGVSLPMIMSSKITPVDALRDE